MVALELISSAVRPLAATGSPAPTAAVQLPIDGIAPLPVGPQRGHLFQPPVTLTVPSGWEAAIHGPDAVGIHQPSSVGALGIARVQIVYKGQCRDAGTEVLGSSPAQMIEWLTSHPHLSASDPVPRSVAGYVGLQVDVVVADLGYCLNPPEPDKRLHLFPVAASLLSVLEGRQLRFIVLDVAGRAVTIFQYPGRTPFAQYLAETEPIIASLEFET